MALSISQLAKENEKFVLAKLKEAEQNLHPSSTEDEELVRRAVFSVRNKSIAFERFNPALSKLYAVVQDVKPASLEIDFYHETIQCNCRQTTWCRHRLGVLLALYQYFESVQNWSSAWRAQKSVQLKTLADERRPESWQMMADEVMNRLLPEGRLLEGYGLSAIRTDALERLQRHIPFEREWQPLYKLFMEVSVFDRIWSHINQTKDTDFDSAYMKYFAEQCTQAIDALMDEMNGKSRLFATDPFYDALQNKVRVFLFERQGLFSARFKIFLVLWEVVFHEKARRSLELQLVTLLEADPHTRTASDLMALGDAASITVSKDVSFKAVKYVFYVLLQKEEQLQKDFENIVLDDVIGLYELAAFAKRAGETWALPLILRAILPFVHALLQEELPAVHRASYVQKLQELYNQISLSEHEEATLYNAFGVYGLQPFSSFLIKKGRFDDWAALHQMYPSSLSYLEICGLPEVLQEKPGAVLPLYHVFAMAELEQKSRMNYKQAVRIWKSMRNAAKKSGKMTYFEGYMQTIQMQFKRLRALQEEIEKGNLV